MKGYRTPSWYRTKKRSDVIEKKARMSKPKPPKKKR